MTTPQMPSPTTRVQTVMFVRHGVAQHNIRNDVTGHTPNLSDPALTDPPLTLHGKRQALDVGFQIKHWWKQHAKHVELVVTSPLTRCLQTAALMFLPGDEYANNNNRWQEEPTTVCSDHVREAFGQHYPDKRRNKAFLMSHWPQVQWDPNMTEQDEGWTSTGRETRQDVVRRAYYFMQWLTSRKEQNVVVVSHGVWMECCFEAYCPSVLANGQRVRNCDLYVGQVQSQNGIFHSLMNVGRVDFNQNA